MFREDGANGQIRESRLLEQRVERPLYGKDLRQHMGWPETFLESQSLLQTKWKIKGEGQVAVAKAVPLKDLEEVYRSVYSRLSPILMLDTTAFIQAVPQVLTYKNSGMDAYTGKLKRVVEILYSKFGYDLPEHVHWTKNPQLFATKDALEKLEARLNQVNLAAEHEAKLLESVEKGGYNSRLVAAIIQRGFKVYSPNSLIGGNKIPYRHARTNTWRGKVTEKDMEDFDDTLNKLIQTKAILVDTGSRNGGRFPYNYSINPHPNGVANPVLRAYLSYVFEKKEAIRR